MAAGRHLRAQTLRKPFCGSSFDFGGLPLLPFGALAEKCRRIHYVLQVMWMAYPDQTSSLQGSRSVNSDILAVNAPGIGSGWQQSKQSWALLAVVGT